MHTEHGMFGLLIFHVNVNSTVLASAISKSRPHIVYLSIQELRSFKVREEPLRFFLIVCTLSSNYILLTLNDLSSFELSF